MTDEVCLVHRTDSDGREPIVAVLLGDDTAMAYLHEQRALHPDITLWYQSVPWVGVGVPGPSDVVHIVLDGPLNSEVGDSAYQDAPGAQATLAEYRNIPAAR